MRSIHLVHSCEYIACRQKEKAHIMTPKKSSLATHCTMLWVGPGIEGIGCRNKLFHDPTSLWRTRATSAYGSNHPRRVCSRWIGCGSLCSLSYSICPFLFFFCVKEWALYSLILSHGSFSIRVLFSFIRFAVSPL